LKIISTENKEIRIGVVDKDKQMNKRYSYGSGNAVCYNGNSGCIYYGDANGKYKAKK